MPSIAAPRRSNGRILVMTAALALLVCAAFQIWRPYFFLTDDNLLQWMPPMVEIARNLLAGKPAFVSASLFGGGYDWSNDATIFPFISPLLPLLSPLARTTYYFALVDIIATFELIVIAGSFTGAALWLRRRHELPIGDWPIIATALSYTFAPIHLIYATSWLGFVNAQAAWPLVFAALQFPSHRRSIAVMFGAFAFSLFGGNLHPFGYLLVGSGALSLYFSWKLRSWRPMLCLATSLMLVAVVAVLLLGPGVAEIATTGSIRKFSAVRASLLNVPPLALVASFLAGPLAGRFGGPDFLFILDPGWKAGIAYSVVNLPVVAMLVAGAWRNPDSRILLAGCGIVALFIWRPLWLAQVIAVTPVLHSTRWPFREVTVLLFFVHVFFVMNYGRLSKPLLRSVWAAALIPLLLFAAYGAPTLNPETLSRRLIISGAADQYWNKMRPALSRQPNVAAADDRLVDYDAPRMPFPLLPSQNMPVLFDIVSVDGYSTSTPLLLDRTRLLPPAVHGIYSPEQARIYMQHFPKSRLTLVHQLDPPIWSIYESGKELRLTLDPETLEIRTIPVP